MTGGPIYSTTFGPFPWLTVPDNTTQNVSILVKALDNENNETKTTVIVTLHSLSECFI